MAFNPNAQLDPSEVEDRRGSRLGTGGTVAVGGGGLGLLVLIVSMLLGVNPLNQLSSQSQQPEVAGVQSVQDCRTGAQANERDDRRRR